MRLALGLACVALVALAPTAAWASHSCHEVSDVVGYEHCTRYGNLWAIERSPPISFELSLGPTWFDPRGHAMGGSFGKNQKGSFSYPGSKVGRELYAVPLSLRFGIPFEPWAYAGLELSFGVGGNRLPATQADGYTIAASSHSAVNSVEFGGGLYGGLRAPLGYLSIRVETFFGGRTIGTGQVAASATQGSRSATVSLDTWVIEPRVFADIWVAPWMTLSAFGGMNALHFTDHTEGLAIAFHGKNYDGAFLW